MIDFEQTYQHRRAVYRAVQESQKSESQIAEQIGKAAVSGKQDLLVFLSAWLLEMDGTLPLSDTVRADIMSLSQMPVDRWQQLQGVAAQMERDLRAAEAEEKAALVAFQKQAPFGAANKLFAAGEKRAELQNLQDDASIKQKHRESLAIAQRQNITNRQSLAEAFFRDCLKNLDKLAVSQTFGTEAAAIIERMTSAISKVWADHQKQQTEEFTQMAGLVEALRVSYKDMPPALPQQDKAPGLQSSSQSQPGKEEK